MYKDFYIRVHTYYIPTFCVAILKKAFAETLIKMIDLSLYWRVKAGEPANF